MKVNLKMSWVYSQPISFKTTYIYINIFDTISLNQKRYIKYNLIIYAYYILFYIISYVNLILNIYFNRKQKNIINNRYEYDKFPFKTTLENSSFVPTVTFIATLFLRFKSILIGIYIQDTNKYKYNEYIKCIEFSKT